MARYFLIATAMLLLASGFTAYGLGVPAMLLFPLPVGLYWARHRYRESLGFVGVAALAGFAGSGGSLLAAALFVVVADLGLLLGFAANRRWSFGACVAAMSAVLFTLGAASMLLNWENSLSQSRTLLAARQHEMEAEAKAMAEKQQELTEYGEFMIETVQWVRTNTQYLMLGAFFGVVLLGSTGVTAVYQRLAEGNGPARLRGSFSTMRVPEWAVWLVIATAGLWLIDYFWHSEVLRTITWNAALGLSFVYWINGLAILTYTLIALPWHPLICLLLGMLVVMQFSTLLPAFGLFDTWYDFRSKLDNLLAAQRARNEEQ